MRSPDWASAVTFIRAFRPGRASTARNEKPVQRTRDHSTVPVAFPPPLTTWYVSTLSWSWTCPS